MASSASKKKAAAAKKTVARKSSTSTARAKTKVAKRGMKTVKAPASRAKKPPRTAAKKRAMRPKSAPPGGTRPSRRAVFIDVENTSSEVELLRVLDSLSIDRAAQETELSAVGNWRTVGQRMGRRLAGLGARLVHSAPATGVRDWSDLWIAVAAGCWLGTALPGDCLDIVSDDRAFDAVGDAAAARGVSFHRISHRTLQPVAEPAEEVEPSRRRGRRSRRRRPKLTSRPAVSAEESQSSAPPVPAAAPESGTNEEAHAASHAQIVAVLTRLTGGSAERWVNLDVLATALKAEGFTRPPASPRLVTRLRKLKDLEVSPNGMVRLTQEQALPEAGTTEEAAAAPPSPRRRPRRRGGRGRSRSAPAPDQDQPQLPQESS